MTALNASGSGGAVRFGATAPTARRWIARITGTPTDSGGGGGAGPDRAPTGGEGGSDPWRFGG